MGKKRRKDKNRDYEVGYGRPPKHSRFKKGQSGNPSGRPKEPTTFLESLNKHFSDTIKVTKNGREYKITTLSALSQKYINLLLSGDPKMLKLFMDNIAKDINIEPYLYPKPDAEQHPEELTEPPSEAMQEIKAIIHQAMSEKIANGETIYDDKPKE